MRKATLKVIKVSTGYLPNLVLNDTNESLTLDERLIRIWGKGKAIQSTYRKAHTMGKRIAIDKDLLLKGDLAL